MIAGRIGEHRSAAPLADGLRLAPLVEQLAYGVAVGAGLALKAQLRADEPLVLRPLYAAVTDLVVGWMAHMPGTTTIEDLHFRYMRPGFLAPRAGVHGQRTAQGAGNAGEELRGAQAPTSHTGVRCAHTARQPRRGSRWRSCVRGRRGRRVSRPPRRGYRRRALADCCRAPPTSPVRPGGSCRRNEERSMVSRGVKNRSAGPPACHEVCFDMSTSCSTRELNSGASSGKRNALMTVPPRGNAILNLERLRPCCRRPW